MAVQVFLLERQLSKSLVQLWQIKYRVVTEAASPAREFQNLPICTITYHRDWQALPYHGDHTTKIRGPFLAGITCKFSQQFIYTVDATGIRSRITRRMH